MLNKLIYILALAVILSACGLFRHSEVVIYDTDRIPATRGTNVCKELHDTVVVYAVFVDVDIYHPWTEFDISSTMDSIKKGMHWIEGQAKKHNQKVVIETIQHKQGSKLSIYEKRAKTSLSLNGISAKSKKAYKKLKPWGNAIAAYTGKGIKYRSSTKIDQRLKIFNVQTLNEALRDQLKRENVAIMFFVNGYLEDHPSYSFYTESYYDHKAEYSIITNKSPSVISHEFLHLFGAIDLYPNYNYPNFNFKEIQEVHENEIMRITHRPIEKLNISPITKYFIGWQDTLDRENTRLLLHKKTLPQY